MRLIDADALKRKAQKLSVEAWKTNHVARVHNVLNQFIDWIDDAPTIDADSKWIPVSERLPEDGEICLVCGKNGGMYVARIDRHGFWTRTGTGKFVTPIAWMELPKPYEVEDNEKIVKEKEIQKNPS